MPLLEGKNALSGTYPKSCSLNGGKVTDSWPEKKGSKREKRGVLYLVDGSIKSGFRLLDGREGNSGRKKRRRRSSVRRRGVFSGGKNS